jgi:DNA-binding CsgD family transcriptional regulator
MRHAEAARNGRRATPRTYLCSELPVRPVAGPIRDELRVLRYLPTNLTAPEIARELSISPSTAKTHIRQARHALPCRGRRACPRAGTARPRRQASDARVTPRSFGKAKHYAERSRGGPLTSAARCPGPRQPAVGQRRDAGDRPRIPLMIIRPIRGSRPEEGMGSWAGKLASVALSYRTLYRSDTGSRYDADPALSGDRPGDR